MQVQPLNPIPSYYAKHGIPIPNQQENTHSATESKAYDVSISIDKSLQKQYTNLLSKYSPKDDYKSNKFEQLKDAYARLSGEINEKYAGHQDELDKHFRALDTAFKSSMSIQATMRSVVMSYNEGVKTESQGLQLQQKLAELSDFDEDLFANNTSSTLGKFADKFIELTKSGSVDNAWNNAISFFSEMETSSVNKLSLNDIYALFSSTFDNSQHSPFLHGIISK